MLNRRTFLGAAAALTPLSARAAAPVTVFAAASLQEALTEAGTLWRGRDAVRFSFGASSAMARQIAQGAPADLFLSADEDWMDWLADRRLIAAGTRTDLLANSLVLIAPARSKAHLRIAPGMPLRAALGGGRLAVADVTAVPAGKYAKAALTALGVWPQVEDRLLPAENVRAALAYVSRGEAPLGVVYATDARADRGVRAVGTFPESSHPPIRYPAAVISATDRPEARDLLAFLRGPKAASVFRGRGFRPLRG